MFLIASMGILMLMLYVEEFIKYGLDKFVGELPFNTTNFLGDWIKYAGARW